MNAAALIEAMRQEGVPDPTILAVVARLDSNKREAARVANAERQRRFRANKASNDVTPVTTVTRDNVTAPPSREEYNTTRAPAVIPVGISNDIPPLVNPDLKVLPLTAEPARSARSILFDRFYAAYPKHTNRRAAEAKFISAVRSGVDAERIISAAERFAEATRRARTEKTYIPAPDVWLNKGRYDDEDLPEAVTPQARAGPYRPPEKRNTVFQAAQEIMAELYGGTDGTSERPSDDFNGTTLDLALEPGGREDGPGGANQASRDDAAASGERGRYEGDVIDLHGPRGRFASG